LKKTVLKIFIAVSGFLFGFSLPVVAQYGAPENIYLRNRIIESEQQFLIPTDTLKCSENQALKEKSIYQISTFDTLQPSLNTEDLPPGPSFTDAIVFPNPCTDKVSVRITSTDFQGSKISLCTISGQIIKEWVTTQQEFTFSMQDYSKGTYLLYIEIMGLKPTQNGRKNLVLIYQ